MVRRLLSFWGPSDDVNSTPMASPAQLDANGPNTINAASGSTSQPTWWLCEVNAQELMRQITMAELPVSPLPVDTIKGSGGGCSKLWAEVAWHREGIGNRVVFDIAAGMRVAVQACTVQIRIVAPPDHISVRGSTTPVSGQQNTLDAGPGLYLDTLLRTSVAEGFAPVRSEGLLTQTFLVPAGDTIFVPKPPGTIGVEIYVPGAAFDTAGQWVEFGAPEGTFLPAGNLGFINFFDAVLGTPNWTGLVRRPGNAAGIASTNTNPGPLPFTYVWHLEY